MPGIRFVAGRRSPLALGEFLSLKLTRRPASLASENPRFAVPARSDSTTLEEHPNHFGVHIVTSLVLATGSAASPAYQDGLAGGGDVFRGSKADRREP